MQTLLTAAEVGKILNVNQITVYQMKARGQLPFVLVARAGVRFHPDDITAYIESNRQRKVKRKGKTSEARK